MHAVIAAAASETPFILFGCALFAAALFIYVFYEPGNIDVGEAKTRYGYLEERKDATYENLRDLSFEYKAGKLSEEEVFDQILVRVRRLERRIVLGQGHFHEFPRMGSAA